MYFDHILFPPSDPLSKQFNFMLSILKTKPMNTHSHTTPHHTALQGAGAAAGILHSADPWVPLQVSPPSPILGWSRAAPLLEQPLAASNAAIGGVRCMLSQSAGRRAWAGEVRCPQTSSRGQRPRPDWRPRFPSTQPSSYCSVQLSYQLPALPSPAWCSRLCFLTLIFAWSRTFQDAGATPPPARGGPSTQAPVAQPIAPPGLETAAPRSPWRGCLAGRTAWGGGAHSEERRAGCASQGCSAERTAGLPEGARLRLPRRSWLDSPPGGPNWLGPRSEWQAEWQKGSHNRSPTDWGTSFQLCFLS